MKEIFEHIYKTNGWRSTETVSGTGSTLEQTQTIRKRLPELFVKYGVESLLDIPCGDFHWMSRVSKDGIKYMGGDILNELVNQNSREHNQDFRVLDITESPLPAVDLIFTRDCFVHLSYGDIFAALHNIIRSESKYILTTIFPGRENRDVETGGWRTLDLQAEPFLLPEPLEVVNEGCTQHCGMFSDKSLAIYDLRQLRSLACLDQSAVLV